MYTYMSSNLSYMYFIVFFKQRIVYYILIRMYDESVSQFLHRFRLTGHKAVEGRGDAGRARRAGQEAVYPVALLQSPATYRYQQTHG